MKISNVILFVLILSLIVTFTKLKNYFPMSPLIIFGLVVLYLILMFWEVHRENKKRHLLVDEIKGGY